ncbi:MAG: rhomboid family intramembrane serine protease, partial [Nannocystaceae bacterium]|nr:rhomboid family intramembrane serine protease [Nannocystaceae bacterium]
LWILGTRVEEVFGHARTLLIVLVFAAGSGAAEYALQDGGVGLSGVGYGLFGVSWWLARYDPRFADAMDQRTARLFAAWFLLCIVLTAAEWLPVANVAHGMGWLQGLAMGAAVATGAKAARSSARAVGVAASVGLLALSLAGATVLRPLVNQSPEAGVDSARLGYLALLDTHNQVAADHLERALALNDRKDWWTNLGIAYRGLGREREAAAAFERADSMAD